jgi:uncharacterized membrane protein YfcA
VSATSVLLSLGVPPATASATVHAAEVFTTGASGAAHWRLKNVRFALVWRLAIPGAVGGALGAFVLASVDGAAIRPFVSAYLLVMGVVILVKAARGPHPAPRAERHIVPLGFVGGLLDAVGGGGWGPVVASTLLGRGAAAPREVIGSVSLAEFFVTVTISATFVATIGLELWPMIAGLIVGGVIAAPLAAYVARALPPRALLAVVGLAVVVLSARGILLAL